MVMDMSTGKIIEDEFGSYEREVMYAEWQPQLPSLQLGLQEVRSTLRESKVIDAESFLRSVYLSQE
jgi:hypothetical protein